MYLHFTNRFIQNLFPHFIWQIPANEKVIYLTFDDGPISEVTPWVLEQLKNYQAKATFFCIGDNIRKHGLIFEKILSEGHSVGNHTFNHLNGWRYDTDKYIANVKMCEEYLHEHSQKLFRPPYGRLTAQQSQILREQENYQIIMWNVLSGDFDQKLAEEKCLKKTIQYTKVGSIVIFHDSRKAKKNLYYTLPRYLEYFSKQGFRFEKL
ncbi:MAG: polysaccharide deacetylase family protein [Thermoflexibacter sp.]